jgi:hypothetical protein
VSPRARALGARRIGSYGNYPDMLHVDFAKGFDNNAGGVHAMHNQSASNLKKAPGWMKAGLQADLGNVGRQAAATTLEMAGLLGLDGRPAIGNQGPAGRRGVVPHNVGTSIPDSLRARGTGAAPISDFRAMPKAAAVAPFERGSFGGLGVVPDNVGTSIPDSLRARGMGAAPMSDFRAMPKAAAAAPFERRSFAGSPGMHMAGNYIGASTAAPFSPGQQTGLRLASLERTPGLPAFQPTPAKSGRYLKAQPDFKYADPTGTPVERQAQVDPSWPGFIYAGDVAGPVSGTGAVAGQEPTLPQHALDPGLLGPSATLAQQEARVAAQLAAFEPRRQPAVATPAPPLSAPRQIAAAPTIAAPDLRATFPPAPPRPEESLLDSIVGPRTAALLGGAVAGVPGAIAGAVIGGLPGLLGRLDNGPMGPAGMAERFHAGFGMSGIEQGMYGPRGATGLSLSNPGAFAVSRGPGQGWDLTNELGVRTTYSPDGHVVANRDTMRAWGGLLGSLFGGGTGGLLGDRGEGKKDRDKEKRDRWSGEPRGLY